MTETPLQLDPKAWALLNALQADGRLSNLKLAELVALSPTAVLARVQRLTREGYILGYEARLNPMKLGAGMLVFVEVLLDRTTLNVFDQFKAAVQVHPEIMVPLVGSVMELHLVADEIRRLHLPDPAADRSVESAAAPETLANEIVLDR